MRNFKQMMNERSMWVNLLLLVLAVITGGASMASAVIGEEGGEPLNNGDGKDPVDPDVNDRKAPGGDTAGQDLDGTQASSTQINRGGLQEDEWDNEITQFHPFRTPLLSIARKISKKINVSNWSIKHMRVGGETLDGEVTADIAAGDTIKLTKENFSGNLRPFYKGSTVFAAGVPGYKRGSKTVVDGELMLYVMSQDTTGVTLRAVNGPLSDDKEEGTVSDYLDDMTCPAIPAGTILMCGATAGSESQLLSPPENYQPRSREVYVQKKLLNIVFTDDYEKVKKKQPLHVRDLKEDAVLKYNLRAERSYWMGVKSRFLVRNADGSEEFVYTADGVMRQLTNYYAIGDEYTPNDLVALSMLQFTDYSENDRAFGFCGKNAVKRLELMKRPDNERIVLNDHEELDLTFKRFTDTFGKIDFIYDQALDLMHMEDYIVIMDLEGARRYVKISSQERTNDMSKGSGEIRDAKRYIRIEADSIALRGYNSILVGPKDKMFANMATDIINKIVSASELPDAATHKGDKIALTEAYTDSEGTTYEAGVIYVSTGSAWEKYTGTDIAG